MSALDILNADCWNAVLNFVPVKDIVRSERVSSQWRNIILQYLQGTQLCLYLGLYDNAYYTKCQPKCRIIELRRPRLFTHFLQRVKEVTKKFGPLIIASHCTDGPVFKVIKRNCPNLQQLMFAEVPDNHLNIFLKKTEKSMNLKWISFRSCEMVTDACVTSFLKNEAVCELDFYGNGTMIGRFLRNINVSRLQSLCLNNCVTLDMGRLILATESLTELTKLEMSENPSRVLRHVPAVLDKLPNLERLSLCDYEEITNELVVDILFQSISRLNRLKRLVLSNNPNFQDKYMETVARDCPLQYLDISCIETGFMMRPVTVRGLQALSQAGGTLRTLSIAHNRSFSSEDMAACVANLPNLEVLDVGGTWMTSQLPEAIEAQARPHSLRIFSRHTNIPNSAEYKRVILDFTDFVNIAPLA